MSDADNEPSLVEPEAEPEAGAEAEAEPEAEAGTEAEPEAEADEELRTGPTPRQARRLRVALASVGMAVMAAVLVVRLASRTSLLVVADYGLALVLCGVVIELSRNGRTRLGTWLLCVGLTAAVLADWLLLP